MTDISSGLVLTDEERAGLHTALADLNAAIANMDAAEKRAHILAIVEEAAKGLGLALAVASGAGIVPAAVAAFGPPTLAAVKAFAEALKD